jgi:HD superfamily phosphodiesterase
MEAYDPMNAPDPDEWQSLDEQERLMLVEDHHRQAGVELPNEQIHAVIHVIVENQIALGDEVPTQATLERMMREGLDRHDAIHAVGSVLANFLGEILAAADAAPSVNEGFFEELKKLKAAEWLESFGDS